MVTAQAGRFRLLEDGNLPAAGGGGRQTASGSSQLVPLLRTVFRRGPVENLNPGGTPTHRVGISDHQG